MTTRAHWKELMKDGIFVAAALFLIASWIFFFGLGGTEVYADSLESIVTVGNVFPEVDNVSVQDEDTTFTLIEGEVNNSLNCSAIITDYNGEDDVANVSATFFDNTSFGASGSTPDDNNYHYTDQNCTLDTAYGDSNQLYAICEFNVTYYATNTSWTCEVTAVDHVTFTDRGNGSIDINPLVALSVPATINYGTVNALNVSQENMTNVTNTGNTIIDLTLEGHAEVDDDGLAMRCTTGSIRNITHPNQRFNLTSPTPGDLTYTQINQSYTALNDSVVEYDIDLLPRENDTSSGHDDFNTTFWRLHVPAGVAGTCNGTIVFGAVAS